VGYSDGDTHREELMAHRRSWLILLTTLVLVISTAAAYATTVTRHQNPRYRVTAALTPTQVSVGERLTISFTVTNTTDHSHRVSISYEYDAPSSGEGAASSPISLAPHTSWKVTFTRRAREAGAYKAIVRAHDALGTSHATATATAG
jgi:uncharacterized protein (DUF58 family)